MRVLFLATNVTIKGPRDGVTYPFVTKEMKALLERDAEVLFLGRHLSKDWEIDGVSYIELDGILKQVRWKRRLSASMYLLRQIGALWRLLIANPRRTAAIIAVEQCVETIIDKYEINVVRTHLLFPAGESLVLSESPAIC